MVPRCYPVFCAAILSFCALSADEAKKSSGVENNEISKKLKDLYFRDKKGELIDDIIDKEIEKRRKEWVKENIKKSKKKKKSSEKKTEKKELDKKSSKDSSQKDEEYTSRLDKWKKERSKQNSQKQ
jgi:hypothetical protein